MTYNNHVRPALEKKENAYFAIKHTTLDSVTHLTVPHIIDGRRQERLLDLCFQFLFSFLFSEHLLLDDTPSQDLYWPIAVRQMSGYFTLL